MKNSCNFVCNCYVIYPPLGQELLTGLTVSLNPSLLRLPTKAFPLVVFLPGADMCFFALVYYWNRKCVEAKCSLYNWVMKSYFHDFHCYTYFTSGIFGDVIAVNSNRLAPNYMAWHLIIIICSVLKIDLKPFTSVTRGDMDFFWCPSDLSISADSFRSIVLNFASLGSEWCDKRSKSWQARNLPFVSSKDRCHLHVTKMVRRDRACLDRCSSHNTWTYWYRRQQQQMLQKRKWKEP